MRQCGSCTLCCKLLPVRELQKPGGQRCRHQRMGKGCAIHGRHPRSCRLWHCAWIDGADTRRPDRCHYVVDIMPDFVTAQYHDGVTPELKIPVLQVWVDPAHPDAHRDADLRALLAAMGGRGMAAIIRYNERDGFVLAPPGLNGSGEWHEYRDGVSGPTHSAAEVFAALAGGMR